MKYIDKYQNQNFEGVLRTILLLQWMIFSVPVSNVHKLSDQQKSIQGLIKRSWTLACDSQRLHLKIWFCFISRVFISPHKLIGGGGFSPTGSRWPSLVVFMARLQPIRNFFMGPSSSSWKIEAIIKIHPLFFKFLSLSNLYFALTNEKINEKVCFCKKYPLLPSENAS